MHNPENEDRAPGEKTTPDGESACVWVQAGVIAQWLCDLDFHCERCPLDEFCRLCHPDPSAPSCQVSPGAGALLVSAIPWARR